MPFLLKGIIVWAISSAIAKIFLTLGIGVFTYYGLESLISVGLDSLESMLNGLPVQVLQLAQLARLPEALSVVTSALLTRAAMDAMRVFAGVATA